MFKRVALCILCVVMLCAARGQNRNSANLWRAAEPIPQGRPQADDWVRPDRFHAASLDRLALKAILDQARHERDQPLAMALTEITLPMPDGSFARFRIVESPVMAPELAAKFPEIKTYLGQGIDDPLAAVRFDITPQGFHAQILSPHGAVYIDPLFRGDATLHASYYKRDYRRSAEAFQCLTAGGETVSLRTASPTDLQRSGEGLRTYRLACAATGEYTQFHGGTVAGGMAAIVTAINRVSGVYETEVAIRLMLVANNDLIVYTEGNTDPYSNNSGSTMLGQNQSNLDAVIGNANYDIGHVFSTAGGGIAGLEVVCVTGSKARGVTGLSSPTGDAFYIDYVAHEMGHQFGASHTFNSSTGSCGSGNRNPSTAYEPGSGSTIMAYAGICGSDNLQAHSDPYFHSISFDEILSYSTVGGGSSCPTLTTTGNNAPSISAGPSYTIPKSTPFTLTASGSDPNGDPLTYCWEERDLGASTTLTSPDNGSSPLFRSFNPTTSPARTFPQLQDLLSNTIGKGETLPTTSRTLHFRVTARDNRAGGGGVNTADAQVTVNANAGPFVVTSHNSGGTFSGAQTVTWNVAGTTAAPINATNVNILLSTNGGLAFPIMLLANTPNDGSEAVVFPNVITSSARLKVEAAGNIFFDLCNSNFAIVSTVPTPLVALDSVSLGSESCAATNRAIDPGETVTVNLALKNIGSASTTNLTVTLLATNGVVSPSGPQSYGVIAPGGAVSSRAFSFTATGTCGGTVTAAFSLQDGANDLGTVAQQFTLGTFTTATLNEVNSTRIDVPAVSTRGKADPYPSVISVAGVTSRVVKVMVRLNGFSHVYPDDVDVVLVGPTGQSLLLMSDTGGGDPVSNAVLVFDDSAEPSLPDTGQIISGTYKPTNFDTTSDDLSPPAPGSPYGQTLSVFNGLDPNGDWSLFLDDDSTKDTGQITQGWSLTIMTANSLCCTGSISAADLVIGKSAVPALVNVGEHVTFNFSVTNLGPDTASNVTVADLLPAGMVFVSASATQGTTTNQAGLVTCTLGTLSSGASASMTVVALAASGGQWTNTASVSTSTSEFNTANNTADAPFTVNWPPVISSILNQTNSENTIVGPIPFTVSDVETSPWALALSGASSNTNLVPDENFTFVGSGTNRSLYLTPVSNQIGQATITLTVSDGLTNTSTSFLLVITPINHRPVLAVISEHVIAEGSAFTLTNMATDPDVPAQSLTFALSNAPVGAVIDMNSGVFSWTPEEWQGPGTNFITVIVTDDGTPSLSDEETFAVVVNEVNTAPSLGVISNYTIAEGETLSFPVPVADADVPMNALAFSLGANAPNGASITQGTFNWTPAEEQGPGLYSITVTVTDDGTPSLSAARTFMVMVTEKNEPPMLAWIPNYTISEGETLTITNSATDLDVPPNALVFSLGTNAPAGATIGAASGVFTWTPTEEQGPVTQVIDVIATDNGSPSLSTTQSFTVTVLESNSPPVLAAILDRTLHAGSTLVISNSATDVDVPENGLTFSLETVGLPDATIDSTSGRFVWTPDDSLAGTTNTVTIRVTDNGDPVLSDTKSFAVTVVSRPLIESLSLSNGMLTLSWSAISGQTYRVQTRLDLNTTGWSNLLPDVTATGPSASRVTQPISPSQQFYRVMIVP